MKLLLFYYFLSEYFLVYKLHLQALITKSPPVSWQKGNKGDVILLLGFGEPWTFLATIGDSLNQKGYRVHSIPELSYNFLPLSKCFKILHDFVLQKRLRNVILISHSKGGLIAKHFLDADPLGNEVKYCISIACPYQGTLLGYIWFLSLKELMPGGYLIKEILRTTKNNSKITNIYAKYDNHIIPNKNAFLPGAKNVMIGVIGHTRILEHKQTKEIILSTLT